MRTIRRKPFEESIKEDGEVTEHHHILGNNVPHSMLSNCINHHVPQVRPQSYVDEAFKRETSILDVDKAFPREVNKVDVDANEKDMQVEAIMDLFPAVISVTKKVARHVEFFIPRGFLEKIGSI